MYALANTVTKQISDAQLNGQPEPGNDQVVVEISAPVLQAPQDYEYDNGAVVKKSDEQIAHEAAIRNFNSNTFSASILAKFNQGEFSTPVIRFEYGPLEKMASQNSAAGFAALKQYFQALVTAGAYIQADFNVINDACKEQNIDLNDF